MRAPISLTAALCRWAFVAVAAAGVALAGPISVGDPLTSSAPAPVRLDGVRAGPPPVGAGRLRFFVVGDLPYSEAEHDQLAGMLADAARDRASFVAHVGDIKGGGQPCSDARNSRIAALFRAQRVPMLYTPGDNEWTDCHRHSAGGRDPLERLAALRRAFFADPGVLHNGALRPVVPDPAYPENAYVVRDGVLLALIHVVGSDNNRRPADPAAMGELAARSAANRALLRQAMAAARVLDIRAFVLLFHANPLFERRAPTPGFQPLFEDLGLLLDGFPGPVLAVHGDTHHYRFDQPLRDTHGDPVRRFWRLEVPGSPLPGGVWVDIDTRLAEPFKARVVYPVGLDTLEALRGD
jgi:hypothetical protein